jgi:hypothetical protein
MSTQRERPRNIKLDRINDGSGAIQNDHHRGHRVTRGLTLHCRYSDYVYCALQIEEGLTFPVIPCALCG